MVDSNWLTRGDKVKRMKIFDMDTVEGVSRVTRPWLCTFICDKLYNFGFGLENDLLSTSIYVFASMGESIIVDQVYRLCACSLRRVASLVRHVYSTYGRFCVF